MPVLVGVGPCKGCGTTEGVRFAHHAGARGFEACPRCVPLEWYELMKLEPGEKTGPKLKLLLAGLLEHIPQSTLTGIVKPDCVKVAQAIVGKK